MRATLEQGVTATERIEVDEARTVSFLGEKGRVYSTPSMVRDIEMACLRLVAQHLDEGESSVGIHISVDHLAATPLGAWVDIEVSVTATDRRKLTLTAEVRDAVEVVGTGSHVRFVVDVERHQERLFEKIQKIQGVR